MNKLSKANWPLVLMFVLCVYESFPTQWPTPHQFTKVPHCSAILLTSFLSKTVKTCCIIKERIWENNGQAKQTEKSLQMVIAAMKLKHPYSLEGKL